MCLFSPYFILVGVKVTYLENATLHGPTIHLPDDGRMNQWICSIGEATNYGENRRTQTKIRLKANSYVTNTAWNPLGSNSFLRGEKPPTNRLNYSRVLDFKFYPFYGPQNQSMYKAATSQAQRKNPIVISSKGLQPNQNKIGSVWWTFLHLLGTFYSYRHLGPEAFVVRSFDLEWQVTQNCILYTHPAYSPVASNFTILSSTANAFLSCLVCPTLLSYLHRLHSVV